MVYEVFVRQLDGCTYMGGGFNCTCASEAMWLYRASQGRVHLTSCQVRTETGDRSGGTNLTQVDAVSRHHGITGGRIYRPISATLLESLVATGKYGFIIQVLYLPLSNTPFDCWSGNFKGNHAMYVSGPGAKPGTWRVADPGADGRRQGIPTGYQDIPSNLMLKAAAMLDIGGRALGGGKAYVYATPPDPVAVAGLSPRYHATVIHPTSVWNNGSKKWVYSGANAIKAGTALIVRSATYVKGGKPCYPIDVTSPNYAGYYVPKENVKLGGKV